MKRAAIAAAAFVLAGCGGADRESTLAAALERTEAAGSARLEIRGLTRAGRERLEVSCEGVADYERERSRMACRFSPLGNIDFVSIGDITYTRLSGKILGDAAPADMKWTREGDTETLHDVLSPEKLLGMLRDAALETERIGEEVVRGESTVRYRLTVDREKAELEDGPGETAPVDVWIDPDGLVRRVFVDDDGDVTIEFFDFGVEAEIGPPPADEVAPSTDTGGSTGQVTVPPCGGVEARPIGIEQAAAALRRNGFSVDERGTSCGRDPVAAVLTNEVSGDASDVLEREGLVSCFLFVKPQSSNVVVVEGADGADARLRLANLECSILADSPRAEEKIRPLKQAFDELKREIQP